MGEFFKWFFDRNPTWYDFVFAVYLMVVVVSTFVVGVAVLLYYGLWEILAGLATLVFLYSWYRVVKDYLHRNVID